MAPINIISYIHVLSGSLMLWLVKVKKVQVEYLSKYILLLSPLYTFNENPEQATEYMLYTVCDTIRQSGTRWF